MAHKNGQLPTSALTPITWTAKVRPYPGATPIQPELAHTAAASLDRLNTAFAAKFGAPLKVNDAYRTLRTQELYRKNRGKPGWPKTTAVAGTSVHGWGLAVDLGGLGGFGSARHEWLRKNAGEHGWWQPPQYRVNGSHPEPWHWEYRLENDQHLEDDMALDTDDRDFIRGLIRDPIVTDGDATVTYATAIRRTLAITRRLEVANAEQDAQIRALIGAVAALAKGENLDEAKLYAGVQAAARAGITAALTDVQDAAAAGITEAIEDGVKVDVVVSKKE